MVFTSGLVRKIIARLFPPSFTVDRFACNPVPSVWPSGVITRSTGSSTSFSRCALFPPLITLPDSHQLHFASIAREKKGKNSAPVSLTFFPPPFSTFGFLHFFPPSTLAISMHAVVLAWSFFRSFFPPHLCFFKDFISTRSYPVASEAPPASYRGTRISYENAIFIISHQRYWRFLRYFYPGILPNYSNLKKMTKEN